MRKGGGSPTVKICADIAGMEVILTVECMIANSGIGFYEFQRQRGFDKGVDYVEDFEVFDVVHDDGHDTPLTDAEIRLVNDALAKDDKLYESLVEKASETLMELGYDDEGYDDQDEDE